MNEELIAPCGMNCGICSSYLAYTNDVRRKGIRMAYCTGCRPRGKVCAFLKKRCRLLSEGRVNYCYECRDFPCERLVHLDRRYRSLYRMSMIENLEYISNNNISQFIAKEMEKWKCHGCGATICCHNSICFNCELHKLKNKTKLYRWEGD